MERGASRFTDALATFEELSSMLADDSGADPLDAAEAIYAKGATYMRLGDFEKGLKSFEDAFAFAKDKLGRRSAMAAKALHNVGIASRSLNKYPAAFDALAEARAVLELQAPPRPIPLAESLEDAAENFLPRPMPRRTRGASRRGRGDLCKSDERNERPRRKCRNTAWALPIARRTRRRKLSILSSKRR